MSPSETDLEQWHLPVTAPNATQTYLLRFPLSLKPQAEDLAAAWAAINDKHLARIRCLRDTDDSSSFCVAADGTLLLTTAIEAGLRPERLATGLADVLHAACAVQEVGTVPLVLDVDHIVVDHDGHWRLLPPSPSENGQDAVVGALARLVCRCLRIRPDRDALLTRWELPPALHDWVAKLLGKNFTSLQAAREAYCQDEEAPQPDLAITAMRSEDDWLLNFDAPARSYQHCINAAELKRLSTQPVTGIFRRRPVDLARHANEWSQYCLPAKVEQQIPLEDGRISVTCEDAEAPPWCRMLVHGRPWILTQQVYEGDAQALAPVQLAALVSDKRRPVLEAGEAVTQIPEDGPLALVLHQPRQLPQTQALHDRIALVIHAYAGARLLDLRPTAAQVSFAQIAEKAAILLIINKLWSGLRSGSDLGTALHHANRSLASQHGDSALLQAGSWLSGNPLIRLTPQQRPPLVQLPHLLNTIKH